MRKNRNQLLSSKKIRKNPARDNIKIQSAVRDSVYKLFPYVKPSEDLRMLTPDE